MTQRQDVDLNELREKLRQSVQASQPTAEEDATPSKQVPTVASNGKIVLTDPQQQNQRQNVTTVPQGRFACPASRLERDRETVRTRLPEGTRELDLYGMRGWAFPFIDELFGEYIMFAFFDGNEYQVKVIRPEMEGKYDVHDAHLYADGTICLRHPGGGMPTLADAYARSVVWANGFSVYQQTGVFPFPE